MNGVVVVASSQKPHSFYNVAEDISHTLGLPLVEIQTNKVQYIALFFKQPKFIISVGTLSPLKLMALSTISRRVIAYIAVEGPFPVPRSIRWLANNTNRLIIVAPSNYVKKELSIGGLKVKYIIPHGINLGETCSSNSLSIPFTNKFADKIKILIVASSSQLRKLLGIFYFLRAWSRLPSKSKKNSFIIMKVPRKLRRRIEEFARSLGISSRQYIVLDTYLARNEVFALYRSADLYVHPTLSDGFGLPVLESLACGTPVIVLNSGPWNEIVNKDVGWLVKVRGEKLVYENNLPYRFKIPDVDDFSRKLAEAINIVRDKREVIRGMCIKHASNFEAHKVYSKFRKII
ncbi:glycosyltransferase family 4 protein [Staphylothermus hellenicus]|uniref:Glycosyl transferase group 1 n=1 Tax=Staphylothermus hellenicus (strain DSM 12710 / JCM 10830 / BK20S6-10-b1 / P8) TaxID=591019 RepID=D7D8A1_STAHD|nr:glycosyltransferase [Staphylothermus hellenicus]ADI31997.1 glycosyl transferase group 1 [Staphylothermus hellenicus DSM 12710]